MKRVLIFGDSNTVGLDPLNNWAVMEKPWPSILKEERPDLDITVDGACHRTSGYTMAGNPDTNGLAAFRSKYTGTKDTYDLIIFMLGINDVQKIISVIPEETASNIKTLIWEYKSNVSLSSRFLIISPPLVSNAVLGRNPFQDLFDRNSVLKSKRMTKALLSAAKITGSDFLSGESFIKTSSQDGIHFSEENHAKLASAVVRKLELMGV